jgi:hypothetical protein
MRNYAVIFQTETGALVQRHIMAASPYHARRDVAGWIGAHPDGFTLVQIRDLDAPATGRRRAEPRDTPVLQGMILAGFLLMLLLLLFLTY